MGTKQTAPDQGLWLVSGELGKRLSWKKTSEVFRTSRESVFRSVEMAVACGRAYQQLSGIHAIGIDEIAWKKGHKDLTLVYQIDSYCKRLLWIGQDHKHKTLLCLKYICSGMWKPYLKKIVKNAGQAIHNLGRFHIMAHFGKALDEVRAGEVKQLKADVTSRS